MKDRESESKSEGAVLNGKPQADGRRVNLGYRLTLKRTDEAVRDAVGDYGSAEVSVSLYEDVKALEMDAEFDRICDSVHAKVAAAFERLGLAVEPGEEPGEDDVGDGGQDD